jgi:hypothetical protein
MYDYHITVKCLDKDYNLKEYESEITSMTYYPDGEYKNIYVNYK